MDKLQAMHVFRSVVDEGGFAAAARALDMSPAGVTRYVSELETDVGARLLQRTTRKVSLTEAGEAYLVRVRQILEDVEDARAAAQAHTMEVAGVLHVAASPLLASHLLAPAIAGFRKLYPEVTFDVSVDVNGQGAVNDYDIKLMSASSEFNGNVIARPIISTVGVLCASPDYLAEHGVPEKPEDLKHHDCLQLKHPEWRSGAVVLTNPEEGDIMVEVPVRPVCQINYVDTLLRAALDGAGIASQPLDLAASFMNDGRLVRVLAPWVTTKLTLYAALPSRKFLPARTQAFLDFLTRRTRLSVDTALARRRAN